MSDEYAMMGPVEPKPASATKVPVWEPQRRYRNFKDFRPRRSILSTVYDWLDTNFERIAFSIVGMSLVALGILSYFLFAEPTLP